MHFAKGKMDKVPPGQFLFPCCIVHSRLAARWSLARSFGQGLGMATSLADLWQ